MFLNIERFTLERQRKLRETQPNGRHPRIVDVFEVNVYLLDKQFRENELKSPRRTFKKSLSRRASIAHIFRSDSPGKAKTPTPAAPAENVKRRGLSKPFIELVGGMAFFPLPKLANLAANDFLKNPTLMVAVYLEWSAAARMLARSGVLSTASRYAGALVTPLHHYAVTPLHRYTVTMSARLSSVATTCVWVAAPPHPLLPPLLPVTPKLITPRPRAHSKLIEELAEVLTLTPAACLDYFDAYYTKIDSDGEIAGFALSGHLLRNRSILDASDAEYAHLPSSYIQVRARALHASLVGCL